MEVIIPEAEGTTHHSALPLRLGSAGSPDFGKEGGGCVAAGRLPALLKVPTHHRWEGCVFMFVCVCVWGHLWVCEQEGHGFWVCPGVCPKPALEHSLLTACFLSAGPWCPEASGHARSLWTLPTEPWSPRFRGSQLWAACGEQTLLAWSCLEEGASTEALSG